MHLKNETYDTLKWVIAIVLPAFVTLVGTVGGATGWEYTELAQTLLSAVTTFFGSVFMVSSASYNAWKDFK